MKRYLLIIVLIILIVLLTTLYILPFSKSASLCSAIRNNNKDAITKQIRSMENVNQYSFPLSLRWLANMVEADIDLPLIVACNEGNKEAVIRLLRKGADPNFYLNGNWSAIEAAFIRNNHDRYEIAQLLIDAGANVNLYGSKTPALFLELQRYIYEDELTGDEYAVFEACVMLLLQNGAIQTDQHGNTYIHYLARKDASLLMEKLFKDYPVDVNYQNSKGVTALMWAAEHGAEEAVKLLISWGADIALMDEDGKTAYDHALENNHKHIAQYLTGGK